MNLEDIFNRFFRLIEQPSQKANTPQTSNKPIDKYQNITSKFHGATIKTNFSHLKEEEALPLLELLYQLNAKELEILKQKIVKWEVSERQTFLNVIGFEKSTPEEKFKYFEKEMFPGYWYSKTNNTSITELYQYIFRYSLLVFSPTPIQQSDLVNQFLNNLSGKDWQALKVDLPNWSSYQITFFTRLLNNHPNSYKYPVPEYFKTMFPDNWQSLSTNYAVASAYRVIVEHQEYDTDYWWEGHGTSDFLRVVAHEFQKNDWQELEEDFKYWSSFQLECLMEAIVAEIYINTETQKFSYPESYIFPIIKLYHIILPILKASIERQKPYNDISLVIINNLEFIDIHFNTFTKKDSSIAKTTVEILKLLGYENDKSDITASIWEKIDTFKE